LGEDRLGTNDSRGRYWRTLCIGRKRKKNSFVWRKAEAFPKGEKLLKEGDVCPLTPRTGHRKKHVHRVSVL